MYRATTSFATNDFDVRYKQILEDNFTTPEQIQEFLDIGYIEVYDDTLEITENGEYDVEDYLTADVNLLTFPPKWNEIGYTGTPQEILDGFAYAKEIYDNWDTSVTNLFEKFKDDKNIKYFPNVDMTNVTSLSNTFYRCSNMEQINLNTSEKLTNLQSTFIHCTFEKINAFNTSKVNWMGNLFRYNSNLKDLPVLDTSNVDNQGLITFVAGCTNLSDESLNNVMQMCIMQEKARTDKTLKYIGLTSAQATRCQSLSNWDAFVDAGWSTGY